ncbi:pentraxin fusion protein-like [Branchiostoma floridae x Branchiostoma belcheri]
MGLILSYAVCMVIGAPVEPEITKEEPIMSKFCKAGEMSIPDFVQFTMDCQRAKGYNHELKMHIKELEMKKVQDEDQEQPDDTCIEPKSMKEVLDIVRDLKKKFERIESGQNIARDKPTVQSSTGYYGFANKAVDGSTNQFYNQHSGGSCTHTAEETDPWWYVDLVTPHPIGTVKIFNRQDCCSDRINPFIVLVDSGIHAAPLASSQQCGGEWGSDYTDKGVFYVNCGGLWGRYVGVSLPGPARILTLCEVEVYAAKNPKVYPRTG